MKRLLLIILLSSLKAYAGPPVQETTREFSAAGDFDGDTFADLLVLDKTSGIYRIGYGSASGALTFAEGRPSGLDSVTGFAVGKLSGTATDSFAVTTPSANRAQILSPLTAGYTEPKPAQEAGIGPKLLAAFDVPGGAGPTAEDDLVSFATLHPAMGTQLRTLRSTAGIWPLLNATNAPEYEVSHGNSLTPATGATPLFAYMSGNGSGTIFHAWQLPGGAATEVLTANGLPSGAEFVAATFETPRADVVFYVPGEAEVQVRRIVPGAPWNFSTGTTTTFSEPIAQIVAVNDGSDTKLVVRFTNGQLALYGYTQAGGFSALQTLVPAGTTGVLSGIVPMPGNLFQLLFAPIPGAASTTVVTYKKTTTGWTQTAVTAMPAHRPLAAYANILLLVDAPFRAPYVPLLRTYRARDWANGVTVGGGPFGVTAQTAGYGGMSQGIGPASGQNVGVATAVPGGTAVNQQHTQFSLFSFNSTLGSMVEDVTISPAAGTYAGVVKIGFNGQNAGSTIYLRRGSDGPFSVWTPASAPSIFSPTTVEYHVRTAAGVTSPTRSARYEFSKPPALQDSDGDGVPDFVELARGLNPAGGPDSDGDGFSDRDEIAAASDPNDAASKPAIAAPALSNMLLDISVELQKVAEPPPDTTFVQASGNASGAAITLHDPFGNPLGAGSIPVAPPVPPGGPPPAPDPASFFGQVTAAGIAPELEYLVARTAEHFDVTPANANARRGREMIALVPVTQREPWSFGGTTSSGIEIATEWPWGGVNWLAGSTNWDLGLDAPESFGEDWSASQLSPQWGGIAPGFAPADWETQFRSANYHSMHPYAQVTLTPLTSVAALITAKIVASQLIARSDITLEASAHGAALAFDRGLAPEFEALRQRDPAHPAAPAFRVQDLLRAVDTALVGSDLGALALRKVARSVYFRHESLLPTELDTLPMPLTALATFVETGALPMPYDLPGTHLTNGDLAAANAKIAEIGNSLVGRPSATFTLTTRTLANPPGLTLVRDESAGVYALFDANLAATALPPDLPPGTQLAITAYTDLPTVAGFPALEVISLEVTSLPFPVGPDADGDLLADQWELRHFGSLDRGTYDSLDGSGYSLAQEYLDGSNPLLATSSPLNAPVDLRFSDFELSLQNGSPRLRVRWPAAYADFVSVSFDKSPNLMNWTDDPAFSGTNVGNGFFTRDIIFVGQKGFFRPRARLKP